MNAAIYTVEVEGKPCTPMDLSTLSGWAANGRIHPDTLVTNTETGEVVAAKNLTSTFGEPYKPTYIPFRKTKAYRRTVVWVSWTVLIFFCAFSAAVIFPVFASARVAAEQATAHSNLKILTESALAYSNDNDDRFPPRMESGIAVKPYVMKYAATDEVIQYTSVPGYGPILGNKALASVKQSSIDDLSSTILFYEEWTSLRGHYVVSFADGRISFRNKRLNELNLELNPRPQ